MTNYLTQAGLAELQAELKEIVDVKLPEVLEAINRALAEGDVSENSGLDAAKLDREKLITRQTEIEDILNDFEIIDEKNAIGSKVVQIGSTLRLMYLHDNKEFEVRIVGSSEADALSNKISNESPLAQAILGKKPGQEASFKVRSGVVKVKLVEIL